MADNLLEHIGDLPQVVNQKDADLFEIEGTDGSGNPTSNKESRLQLKNNMAAAGPVPDMVDTRIDAAAGIHDFETARPYRKGAVILRLGSLWRAKNAFTSGTGFIEDEWEQIPAGKWGTLNGSLADQADLKNALDEKLDREIDYGNGVESEFFHESDGGGYRLNDNNDNSVSFVGGNADASSELKIEAYAKNRTTNIGTRIMQTLSKIFYTKNKADMTVTNGDEIAVLSDVADSLAQSKNYTDGKVSQVSSGSSYQGKLDYYGVNEAALAEFTPAEGQTALVADVKKIGTYTSGSWILEDIDNLQEGFYWLVVDLGGAEKHYQGQVIYNAQGGWDINEDRHSMPDGVTLDYDAATGALEVADIHAENVTADDTDFGDTVSGGFHAVLLAVFGKIRGLFALLAGKVNIQQNTSDAGKALVIGEDGLVTTGVIPAPLASPELTGTPTAPTAEAGTNTTQLATTAFVQDAVSGGGGGGGGITQFTFLVDSDAALAAWANNTAGNDYTSVLIAPGTWTSSVAVNLTTSGTKVVVGMPGSKLIFTSQYGLRYTALPTTTDYRMEGVNVEVNYSGGNGYAFSTCANLTNCTGTMTSTGGTAYGFSSCTTLTNCTGTGAGTNGNAYAFYSCVNLTGCTGTGTSSGGSGNGFRNCSGMLLNKPGTTASTTATYYNCFVSISGSGAAPSDTALGGYNKGAGTPADALPIANGGTGAATAEAALANLGAISSESPELTGTPTAPTAEAGTNTTQIATTAFVQGAVGVEAEARDAAIAAAQLAVQTWLAAVDTKADLPDPAALTHTTSYLGRVMRDETATNTGVWQLIAGATVDLTPSGRHKNKRGI
jgi:hypothetical protein